MLDQVDAADADGEGHEASQQKRRLGTEPRIALLAFSTFGHPQSERSLHVQEAVRLLDAERVRYVALDHDPERVREATERTRELHQAYDLIRQRQGFR